MHIEKKNIALLRTDCFASHSSNNTEKTEIYGAYMEWWIWENTCQERLRETQKSVCGSGEIKNFNSTWKLKEIKILHQIMSVHVLYKLVKLIFVISILGRKTPLKSKVKIISFFHQIWENANFLHKLINLNDVIVLQQLHNRFDALKRQHTEEKRKLEESKKRLEDEMNLFAQQKAHVQAQASTIGKKKK